MSKPKPKSDDLKEFVDEFKTESDRAAVLLGSAKIDALLYQILDQFLKPTVGSRDDLLDSDGALGTFSAKINIVYRLRLLDDKFCRALHLIRKIRNTFAHEVKAGSLNEGAHSSRVIELIAPIKDTWYYKGIKGYHFGKSEDVSQDFKACLVIIVGRLSKLYSTTKELSIPEDPLPFIDPTWTKANKE